MATLETSTSLPAAVQELLDKEAIREVIVRFCRGWDRLERDLVQSCYHPGAVDDHGIYNGPAENFFDQWAASPMSRMIHHHLGQTTIELDGDTASAETYCLATVIGNPAAGTDTRLIMCRYLDRFDKRGGEWKIADRYLAFDAEVPVADGAPVSFPERNLGMRDRNDYSHRLFPPAG
jgi:hypothetical protein